MERHLPEGTPPEDDDPAVPRRFSGYRPGGISLDGATMFSVAEVLSLPQARSLLGGLPHDQTGLKGRYTMDLDYLFAPPRPADPGAPPDVAGPSLPTAIQEQWGMRLVPGNGPCRLRRGRERAAASRQLKTRGRACRSSAGATLARFE